MKKKVYEAWFGKYWIYQDENFLNKVQNMAKSFPKEWLSDLWGKRNGYYQDVIFSDVQEIHRPPIGGDLYSINGSFGVKFQVLGPKWQIRKLLQWKRRKIKKWMNNKRISIKRK